jgi:hypothetical protein
MVARPVKSDPLAGVTTWTTPMLLLAVLTGAVMVQLAAQGDPGALVQAGLKVEE